YFLAEDFTLALEQALLGGQQAQQSFAYAQAERAYRLALEASQKGGAENLQSHQARLGLGEVLSYVGRNEEAMQLWREVIEQASQLEGGGQLVSQARLKLGNILRFSGSVELARDVIGQYGIDDPFYEELEIEASHIHRLQKDFIAARRHGLQALRMSKLAQNSSGTARALLALSQLEVALGNINRATTLAEIATKIVETTDDDFLKTIAWNDLGSRFYIQGQQALLEKAWGKASDYAQKTGDVRSRVVIQTNLALAVAGEDEFEEARDRLKASRELAIRAGLYAQEKLILYNLAEMEYALGNLEVAREHFQDVKNNPYEGASRVWESRITLELGDGFVFELPELEGSIGSELRQLLEVLHSLSFGDYEKAYELTAGDLLERDWFWRLARLHAAWRLGQDTTLALASLRQPAPDTKLAPALRLSYLDFVQQLLLEPTPERKQALLILAEKYRTSGIGLLARDVLLSLA
ncbi:MAG: tetratricopeptide repeat protein, partial [Deinococcales bacterium]